MDVFWAVISIGFVVGTMAIVAFAVLRVFGGGHWHRHQH